MTQERAVELQNQAELDTLKENSVVNDILIKLDKIRKNEI